jgi:hypothetical protein
VNTSIGPSNRCKTRLKVAILQDGRLVKGRLDARAGTIRLAESPAISRWTIQPRTPRMIDGKPGISAHVIARHSVENVAAARRYSHDGKSAAAPGGARFGEMVARTIC